jgi:hypothetical protein
MTQCEVCSQTDSEGIDDLEAYVATFSEKERQELAAAELALDIAILWHRARDQGSDPDVIEPSH